MQLPHIPLLTVLRSLVRGFGVILIITPILGLILFYRLHAWEAYQQDILQTLQKTFDRPVTIEGAMRFELFPSPYVEMEHVHIPNTSNGLHPYLLSTKRLRLYFDLPSLLIGSTPFHKIELGKLTLNLENLAHQAPNWQSGTGEAALTSLYQSNLFTEGHMHLKESVLRYSTGTAEKPYHYTIPLKQADFTIEGKKGPFALEAQLGNATQKHPVRLQVEAEALQEEGTSQFTMHLAHKQSTATLQASVRDALRNPKLKGQWSAELSSTFWDELSYPEIALDMATGGPVFEQIAYALFARHKTRITTEIHLSKKAFSMTALEINAGPTEGKGAVHVRFDEITPIALKLAFNQMHFDTKPPLLSVEELIAQDQYKNDLEEEDKFSLPLLPPGIRWEIALQAEQTQWENTKMGALTLDAMFSQQASQIKQLQWTNLPGQATLKLHSKASQWPMRSTLEIEGQQPWWLVQWLEEKQTTFLPDTTQPYQLEADVIVGSAFMQLPKVKFQSHNTSIVGQAQITKQEEKILSQAALRVNQLPLDYITNSMKSQARSKRDALFALLRRVNHHFDTLLLSLQADRASWNNVALNNIQTLLHFYPGTLEVKNASLQTEQGPISLAFTFDMQHLRPDFALKIEAESLNDDLITRLIGWDTPPPATDQVEALSPFTRWSNRRLDWEWLSIYTGTVHLKAKSLLLNGYPLQSVDIKGHLDGNMFYFDQAQAKLYEGRVSATGTAGLLRPSLNFSFSASNIDTQLFVKNTFGTDNLQGKFSASGGIAMVGYSPQQWMESLDGRIHLISRQFLFDGADLLALAELLPELETIKEVRYWGHRLLHRGQSSLDYIDGLFAIDRGVVTLNNFRLNHPWLSAARLQGEIDLLEWAINLKANLLLNSNKRGGGEIPLNYTLDGDLNHPFGYWNQKSLEEFWAERFFRKERGINTQRERFNQMRRR